MNLSKTRVPRLDTELVAIIVIAVIALALCIFAIVASGHAHDDAVADCDAVGGRLIEDTDTSVGTTFTNGKVGTTTTTSTDLICLNDAGGIIWIR